MMYLINIQISIFIIVISLNIINSTESNNNCESEYQTKCDSGKCIESIKFCDGNFDCDDRSDETEKRCANNRCSRSRFHCTYGGCIAKHKICNGIQDCYDNSDESSCPSTKNRTINSERSSQCQFENQFECLTNGECIDMIKICDNNYDCRDNSDENFNLCKNFRCSRNFFKCKSGGCIHRYKKCNGKFDCIDGSDENEFAGCSNILTFKKELETFKCIIPNIKNLKIYRGPIENNHLLVPNEIIQPAFEEYNYECEDSFKIYSMKTNQIIKNYCSGNENKSVWINDHPVCKKFCKSSDLKGITFQATCDDQLNDCQNKIEHPEGTKAFLKCSYGYETPNNFINITTCNEYGEWNYSPKRCDANCGIINDILVPYMSNGVDTIIDNFPWQAAIFLLKQNAKQSIEYQNICGGTIINPKLVITAAHCFFKNDAKTSIKLHESNFMIVVGTSYRSFDKRDYGSQAFSVEKINSHYNFKGFENEYLFDVAIAILNDSIIFNNFIVPICYESYTISYANIQMKSGVRGLLAGWGRKSDNTFPENLQLSNATTLSYDECKEKDIQRFAQDKFCLDYSQVNASRVCHGDSGGGFVEPKLSTNGYRYYLRGILSTGYYTLGCGEGVAAFTNIYENNYLSMINDDKLVYDPK